MRRVAVAGALTLAALTVGSSIAVAAAPDQQGWWEGESELGPLGDPLADLGSVDVPDDGLLVQGGNAEPAAIAAATFSVRSHEIVGPLRLVPHPDAASVPGSAIEVCPLDDPMFEPARGGSADDAPGYDCFGAVPATIDEAGTFVVDVTTLRRGDHVAIAIVPASSSSRVVLKSLGDDALDLVPIDTGGLAAPQQPRTPDPSPIPTPSVGVGSSNPPTDTLPAGPAPLELGSLEPSDAEPHATSVNEGIFGGAPVVASDSSRNAGPAIVFGLVAALAAALWFVAGQLGLARSHGALT